MLSSAKYGNYCIARVTYPLLFRLHVWVIFQTFDDPFEILFSKYANTAVSPFEVHIVFFHVQATYKHAGLTLCSATALRILAVVLF